MDTIRHIKLKRKRNPAPSRIPVYINLNTGQKVKKSAYYSLPVDQRKIIYQTNLSESTDTEYDHNNDIEFSESNQHESGTNASADVCNTEASSLFTISSDYDEDSNRIKTIEQLDIYLSQLQCDYSIPTAALESILKTLPTVEPSLFKELPNSKYSLQKRISRLYKSNPMLVVECKNCHAVIAIDGETLAAVLGKGWFCLTQSYIVRKLHSKNFKYYCERHKKQYNCKCQDQDCLKVITRSPFFWIYSSFVEYIQLIYRSPLLLAQSLAPLMASFPENIQKALLEVIDKRYKTYIQMEQSNKDIAVVLKFYFITLTPESIKLIWRDSESRAMNEKINEAWHGFRFWESMIEGGFELDSLWTLIISVMYDWFSPFKNSSTQSMAQILISSMNHSRYVIAARDDIYIYPLGYLPSDYHLTAEDVQRYFQIFINDIIGSRDAGIKVYNCFLDDQCIVKPYFGVFRADSPAAHQGLWMQTPGRAGNNCRRCEGTAETCTCGKHAYWAIDESITEKRTKERWIYKANKVTTLVEQNAPISHIKARASKHGYKGNTVFNQLPECNPAYDFIHEAMHLFFFNVCPHAPIEWLTSTHNTDKNKYYKDAIPRKGIPLILQQRFEEMTYLRHINRKGRCFLSTPNKLIAEEWKVLVLLIILPLFRGLIKRRYLEQFRLIYKITKQIFSDNISRERLQHIDNNVKRFHELQKTNYGQCKYKLSTHSLQHVVEDIKTWGHVKSVWTAQSEGLAKGERKRLEFTNGKKVNNTLSKLGYIQASISRLSKSKLGANIQIKSNLRDQKQAKEWEFDIAEDNTIIWFTNKGRTFRGINLLMKVVTDNSTNLRLKEDFNATFAHILKIKELHEIDPYEVLYNSLIESSRSNTEIFEEWQNTYKQDIEFSIYYNINIGYRQYYGVSNRNKVPVPKSFDNYEEQGEWLEINFDDKRYYGRIRRMISVRLYNRDFLSNNVISDVISNSDYNCIILVQFYDYLKPTQARDRETGMRLAVPLSGTENSISYFQNIGCIRRKVAIQRTFVGNTSEPDPNKFIVQPWYSWC